MLPEQRSNIDILHDPKLNRSVDLGVKVYILFEAPQRHDQRIARLTVVALFRRAHLPPAADRIDRQRAARRQFGAGALPNIAMQRARRLVRAAIDTEPPAIVCRLSYFNALYFF